MNKEKGMQLLRNRGAFRAVVTYSGGNDSGGVDSVELEFDRTSEDGAPRVQELEFVDTYDWKTGKTIAPTPAQELDNELHALLSEPVYEKWYSFAGDYYVNGTVTWDVLADKVVMREDVEVPASHEETQGW